MGAHENAGKDIFYEESMRIPMILSWPDQIKPRKSDPLMIAFADLYPTLLSMMGFSKEIPETVQTFDLSNEVLTGKNKKDLVQPYYFVKFEQVIADSVPTDIHMPYTQQTERSIMSFFSTVPMILMK